MAEKEEEKMIKFTKTIDTFEDLQNTVWSGAVDTLKTIEKHDKGDELMDLLSSCEWESETAINDYLWFDNDNIFEILDIEEE